MGQLLHGCARTTEAVRRAIQHSRASLNALASRYGINPKTVAKWRQREHSGRPDGPKTVQSSVLTAEEEAAIVAFRKYTLLPLDDCLYLRGIHLAPLLSFCGFLDVSDDIGVSHGLGHQCLFQKTMKEQSARAGSPTIEAEDKFVKIRIQLVRLYGAVMGARESSV